MDPKQEESGQYSQELDYYVPHHTDLNITDLKKIRIKYLGPLYGVKIYMVDGEYLRNGIYVDYTNGGNPGRYTFVPEGEIWVDREKPNDFAATVVHEFVECHHMMKNKKSYDPAHEIANKFEREFRLRVKDGRINLKSYEQIVPYLSKWLKMKKSSNASPGGHINTAGDFQSKPQAAMKFGPERNAQF